MLASLLNRAARKCRGSGRGQGTAGGFPLGGASGESRRLGVAVLGAPGVSRRPGCKYISSVLCTTTWTGHHHHPSTPCTDIYIIYISAPNPSRDPRAFWFGGTMPGAGARGGPPRGPPGGWCPEHTSRDFSTSQTTKSPKSHPEAQGGGPVCMGFLSCTDHPHS